MATQFYVAQLGDLLRGRPILWVAGLFYLLYAAGVVYFCIRSAKSQQDALVNGIVLGVLAFATYDVTNYATLRGWPLTVVFVDIGWGAFIAGAGAVVGFRCANSWR